MRQMRAHKTSTTHNSSMNVGQHPFKRVGFLKLSHVDGSTINFPCTAGFSIRVPTGLIHGCTPLSHLLDVAVLACEPPSGPVRGHVHGDRVSRQIIAAQARECLHQASALERRLCKHGKTETQRNGTANQSIAGSSFSGIQVFNGCYEKKSIYMMRVVGGRKRARYNF